MPLIGLAKDIFGINVKEIHFEDPYSIDDYKEYLEGKEITTLRQTIRDVGAKIKVDDNDKILTSELQLKHNDFFTQRSLYYPFKRYCDNYNVPGKMYVDKEGNPNRYSSLLPIYEIVILGYKSFPDNYNLRVAELYDPARKIGLLEDLIKIAYFEFKKTNTEKNKAIGFWRDFFLEKEISKDAPDYIREAAEITNYVNMSKEEQALIDQLEKAIADYDAEMSTAWNRGEISGIEKGLKKGIEKGIEKGVKKGKEEERILSIRFMHEYGMPIEKIADNYSISIEKVMEYLGQLPNA